MKSPPDEKTLDVLNASSRDRKPGGKWRFRVAVVSVILLLIAGIPIILESYRQSEIGAAKRELATEVQLAQDRYAGVNDWPTWYQSQLPDDCDSEALAVWIARCEASGLKESRVTKWVELYVPEIPNNHNQPSVAEFNQFIAASQAFADEARELLRYPHLSRLPSFENGSPHFTVLRALEAFHILRNRILVLTIMDRWDQAWTELESCLRVVQRWDHPCSRVDSMIGIIFETSLHRRFREMIDEHPPTPPATEALQDQPPTPDHLKREVLEYELAFFSQVAVGFDPDSPESFAEIAEVNNSHWFDYLSPTMNWTERKRAFRSNVALFNGLADYLRQIRQTLEKPNGTVSDLNNDNAFLSSLESIPADLYELSLARQGTSLLCRVLSARETNDELTSLVLKAVDEYPDHEVVVNGDSIVIRVRYGKDLLSRLPYEYADEDEFYEIFQPVRIPLTP